MQIRYDFGEKLDVTKFVKQAKHYIAQMPSIQYYFVLPHYKMVVQIDRQENVTSHLITVTFSKIWRDQDGEINSSELIYPAQDIRFKDLKIIQELWLSSADYSAKWSSNSVAHTVDKMVLLLKLIHKINNLQVFV